MKTPKWLYGTAEAVPFQVIINMDIAEWRVKIDELDRQLVALISERARCAVEIGRLKQNSSLPVYEPDRERIIFENIQRENHGPLSQVKITRVLSSRPCFRIAPRICPTDQSSSMITSP